MKVKTIFWDFDGVILDSMKVRDLGFRKVLADFPENQVDELIQYHNLNGGLSRYVKFRYFYERILHKTITDDQVQGLADEFSQIMKVELIKPEYIIRHSMQFIEEFSNKIPMFIVSGSDQTELRYLCKSLKIESHFQGIYGSPTPKAELIENIINSEDAESEQCLLIGDSINDFEAANNNGLKFCGFNNESLRSLSDFYIDDYKEFANQLHIQ